MSYRSRAGFGAITATPPDATGQALAILAACATYCAPIAAGVAGGFYVGKNKGAVAPVAGALIGGLFSVLWLRSAVLSGSASVARTA